MSLKALGVVAIFSLVLSSCSRPSGDSWTSAVPQQTSFIIIPAKDASVQSVLKATYIPFMEDLTTAAIQSISKIDSTAASSLQVQSIMLYPAANQKLQPIWVTRRPDDFKQKLIKKYGRKFAQNEYQFHDISILNLRVDNRPLFVAALNDFLLISKSSLGIEDAIRAYHGLQPGADLADVSMVPSSVIMNTPSLNRWISQLARVTYQPNLTHLLAGTLPATFTFKTGNDSTKNQFKISGTIPLSDDFRSPLLKAISSQNNAITLDNYISADAAAFGIFHVPAPKMNLKSLPDTSAADAYLMHHGQAYNTVKNKLGTELALVMYAQSGFLSTGEYLFIRKLKDPAALRRQLQTLSQNGVVKQIDGNYFVQSYGLAQLLGSRLCNFKNFYINLTGDAAVISKRKGLAERVASDRNRRSVVSYEPYYEQMRSTFPPNMSSLFVTGSEFNSFLTPLLSGNTNLHALTAPFKHFAVTTKANDAGTAISVNLATFNTEDEARAFRENWVYNTGKADLSGTPVFGNIGGSYNKEVVFASRSGKVYALAADGTIIQQYNTGRDTPVGSPLVYDWYGTGRNVVLIAAGNKIYGWDKEGELLPEFPLRLDETITTPLTVADVNHNKSPNAIVGTADRKLHILNGHGDELAGWPVTTNAAITTAPLVEYFQGVYSIVSFAANAVHAWDTSGSTLPGFPLFINASFRGSPSPYKHVVLGGAVDGKLYAIGEQIPFVDSLNVYKSRSPSSKVKAIDVSGSALSGSPAVQSDQILTTTKNGSIFLFDADGKLQLTKNMGQPAAAEWSSQITDLDGNGKQDVVALANYGRLYAWQIPDGKRLFNLPKAGMSHLAIGDIDGDGLKELVAQTDKGIRCWTINRKQ